MFSSNIDIFPGFSRIPRSDPRIESGSYQTFAGRVGDAAVQNLTGRNGSGHHSCSKLAGRVVSSRPTSGGPAHEKPGVFFFCPRPWVWVHGGALSVDQKRPQLTRATFIEVGAPLFFLRDSSIWGLLGPLLKTKQIWRRI